MGEKRHISKPNVKRVDYKRNYRGTKILILTLCGVVFAVNVYSHFHYTPDDTYIYLQYAKNMTNGNGISFNAGEPTYGITSPLWLFIITAGGVAGLDVFVWAKIVDILFACAALFIFYISISPLVEDFAIRACATVAFSLNVWFLRWAGTGMETSLGIVLFLASFGSLLRRKYMLSSAFTGLLGLVRPEGLLFYPVILAAVLKTEKKNVKKLISASMALIAVPVIPWFMYAYHTFGRLLPDTALAKAGLSDSITGRLATLTDMTETAVISDGPAILVCIVSCAFIFYSYKYWKSKGLDSEADPDGVVYFMIVGIAWIIILPVFYLLADVNFISRYFLIISPAIVMFAYYFIHKAITIHFRPVYLYPAILAFTVLLMIQNQIAYIRYVKPGIDAFTEGMNTSLIPIGKWFKLNTPDGTRIFAQDVGAIGYYSDRYICDAAGLVSPPLLRLQRMGYSHRRMVDEKVYTTECGADYVVYRSLVPDELNNKKDLSRKLTLPFSQMGISDRNLYYYSVYSVRNADHNSEKRKGQHE